MKKQLANENIIPAVEKTIRVLNAIAFAADGMTLPELSESQGLTASTAYRLLQTLLKYDWVEKRADGIYQLSRGLLPIALQMHQRDAFGENVQELLERLSAETALACKLSIRQNLEQLTLARADAPGPFGISGRRGARFPLAEGSVGAALLCRESDDFLKSLLASCENRIPETEDPRFFLEACAEVRNKGYTLNLNHNRWKIAAMSCPVHDADGRNVIAALTLLGLPDDFKEPMLPSYFKAMRRTARALLPQSGVPAINQQTSNHS